MFPFSSSTRFALPPFPFISLPLCLSLCLAPRTSGAGPDVRYRERTTLESGTVDSAIESSRLWNRTRPALQSRAVDLSILRRRYCAVDVDPASQTGPFFFFVLPTESWSGRRAWDVEHRTRGPNAQRGGYLIRWNLTSEGDESSTEYISHAPLDVPSCTVLHGTPFDVASADGRRKHYLALLFHCPPCDELPPPSVWSSLGSRSRPPSIALDDCSKLDYDAELSPSLPISSVVHATRPHRRIIARARGSCSPHPHHLVHHRVLAADPSTKRRQHAPVSRSLPLCAAPPPRVPWPLALHLSFVLPHPVGPVSRRPI